jgi:hypothetical protein
VETREQVSEAQLLDGAIEVLSRRLPSEWVVEKTSLGGDPEPRDLIIKSPNAASQAVVLVEARAGVSARDVQVLMGGPWKRWRRQTGNQPILLIAPYIGPRVRELLTEENVSYVDLTGNVRISLNYPSVFIELQGAERDPFGTKPRRGLRGAKVGAVVRVLADAAPPYTGAEIARAANVNEGYLSRILETLSDEGLIERESSGPVTGVDWPAMLRRRAQALDLFRSAGTYRYVAREGTRRLLEDLQDRRSDPPPTITGSFAAARLAPVAAPTLLVVYTMTARELADDLRLLPAEAGADTVLVRPDNEVVFARSTRDEDGLTWAAPSQVAIDCLAGSGRMPAEGDAVIDWMRQNESRWRYPSMEALLESSDRAKV